MKKPSKKKPMTHAELKAKILADPKCRKAYNDLEEEFALFGQVLAARKRAKLSQAEIAQRMGTKLSAVTRLESSLINGSRSPSFNALQKYAHAVGCKVQIKFIKQRPTS